MRYRCLLLFCLFYFTMQGQITNLNKLSQGKFYSSDVIRDNNNSIKGYFVLFESDKIAKETVELEYVVLDENLQKVTNGFIKEMIFESWLMDADKITVRASLYKNKLLLHFADYDEGVEIFNRYRVLDIKSNEMSEPFIFNSDSLKVNPEFSRKMVGWKNFESEKIDSYDKVGLVVDSKVFNKKKKLTKRFLAHYDDNLKEVWRWNYSDINDKRVKYLTCLKSDEEVIVLFNHYEKNGSYTYVNNVSSIILDAKNGKVRNEFDFPNLDKLSYRVVDCVIKEDKIYLMGDYSKKSKYGHIDDLENIGMYSFTFDKASGKLLSSDYLKWESLVGKLDINKKGYVKKEGYMYPHNMLLKDDGNIIVIAETFMQSPVTTNNMYFFELDNKLAVKQLFEVAKFKNKYPSTAAHSTTIKRYGYFDFMDYQVLGDDEYLFFLNDNEKNSRNRKASTLYGIVSYSDGKFKRQTLNLKTETSTIKAYGAKKGYLLLIENFDVSKPAEFRLEKINY